MNLIRLFGLILLVSFVSCKKKADNTSVKNGPQAPLSVEGIVAKMEILENNISITGNILPYEEVVLLPEIQGRIIRINFEEGRTVQKGQLLVKLNDAELQAGMSKAKVNLELAKVDNKRKSELLQIKAIPQDEYDISETEVLRVQADIALLEAQIEKTEIRAPFAGIIGLRQVSLGSFVQPGQAIATLSQTQPMKIEFSVPEKYSSIVKPNSTLQFTVEGLRDTFNAKMYAVDSEIDVNSRTFKIRATAANPAGKLKKGAFANVNFLIDRIEKAVMVPTQALIPEIRGQKVIVLKGGKATFQMVETGVRTANRVQIISGINEGDTIVTSGLLQLREGMDAVLKETTE